MQGIEVHDTDRGGRVTYHGPGQLVAYPIVSLKPYGDDVHEYVRRLEQVAIEALAEHGVEAGTIEGLTGVWTAGANPFPSGATEPSVAEDVTAGRHARSARSASTSAAASPPTAWRSTSTTTCSRSSGSSPAGSRAAR